ncbi:IclR family transcriptional regulator [Pseudonocardia sp. CNS-139]|nr:IclR family transcriptional regulator [Pseudonocardia sp. CNS-139]
MPSERETGRGRRGRTGSVTLRALRLLEGFSAEEPELTLTELAHRSGLPVTTVYRLATALLSWGALERLPDGRFRIGLRLWEVASLAPRGLGLRRLALPVLQDLSHVTRENVQLGVRDGDEVVFLERIAGRAAVPVLTRVGGRFPLTATGLGLALLAYAPLEVAEQVASASLRRFTPYTLTDPTLIAEELAATRRRGFAVSDRQISEETLSVAAPIFGPTEVVVAAVSLVVRADGATPWALGQLVQTSARAIGRSLAAAAWREG